jgi:uncharacterized protein (TIGR01777 family)
MTIVFILFAIQITLGALDNLWHHELTARLPQRASARLELSLHAAREATYGVVFFGLAWFQWHGLLALLLAALMVVEIVVTLADFVEEDRTRRLPAFERVLHTLLAVGVGAILTVMAPLLLAWARYPSALQFVNYGIASIALTICAFGVTAWSIRNVVAVRRMTRVSARTPSPAAAAHIGTGAILVTGATGFIGTALVEKLMTEQRRLVILTRDVRQARASFGEHVWIIDRLDAIPAETSIDAVVNLAGAPILGMPWTDARRKTLVQSRAAITIGLVALMRRLHHPPRVMVSASAVGYYGVPDDDAPLHERSPSQPGRFQSDLCIAIEHEARRAEGVGVRVVRLRFGIVLGQDGGAYPSLALAARHGLGAILGSGRQPVPWIHRDDAVGLIQMAIERNDVAGPVNAVAPHLIAQSQFARAIAAAFGKRVRLRFPGKPFEWLMGEMSELLLAGQNVVPRAAELAGYQFRHPTIELAAQALATSQNRIQ